jgi:histidyl-tRNA synthetase
MQEPAELTLTLHPNAVVAPALRAVQQSVDMVSFSMQSLESADLSKPPEYDSSRFQMKFAGDESGPEERKTRYANWILSKGFQDLARGVRGMLEEAYFYIKISSSFKSKTKITWDAFQKQIAEYRKEAEDAKFPELMDAVNEGLSSPLHFETEFRSLQKVRNCLEHRDGLVSERDVDPQTNSLKLSLPHLRMYGEKDGIQIEIGKGSHVEKDTFIVLKNEIEEREFKLGERVTFRPEEFHDIGFGCWVFANDLGSKLPVPNNIPDGATAIAPTLEPPPEKISSKTKANRPSKAKRLRARLPRGLEDRDAGAINATKRMTETIREVFERYGFEPVETPAMEYTDALGKFLPDQDRPNEGVFSFQDDDEQWISLRYDLTAPLARYVSENFDSLPKPYRSYRTGYVYRNEKPGPGRFRQFMQFDADTVGSASPAADAEMCMMAADTMEKLGIPRGSYVVKVNNRKVLDGVMESIGLGGEENAGRRLTVLRAIDKLDRLGPPAVAMLLGAGRKDESGDITEGAKLSEVQISEVLRYLDIVQVFDGPNVQWNKVKSGLDPNSSAEQLKWLQTLLKDSDLGRAGIAELTEINTLISGAGYDDGRVLIDPSVVRGLEYYTGPVYEVELTIPTEDEKGRPVRFGSVGGGGRYDGLVSRFRGETVPATGFSIGVSRLQSALTVIGKLDVKPEFGPVVVTVFDRERISDYQKMVATLRNAHIRAELYLGNPKNMGNQLKYADARNSPCAIVQGSNEREHPNGPHIIVQDLIAGRSIGADIADRDEYLKKKSAAQEMVPLGDLVAKVREVLARHEVKWT